MRPCRLGDRPRPDGQPRLSQREVAADLVIVGGGLGGCAAALAALEKNLSVILTEPTDWIGGQLTAQAVPPDEHGWIEQFGRNARTGRSARASATIIASIIP